MNLNTILENKYFTLIVFSLFSFFIYFKTFSVGLLSDDYTFFFQVQENGWKSILNNFNDDFFLPLTHVFQVFIYALFGPNLYAYHAIQLLIHIIIGWQIYLLLKRFTVSKNLTTPFLSGLIFLILPYQTESVIWLSSIGYVICLLFTILSIRYYLKNSYLLFYLFLVFSIFSKEMGYVIPIAIILIDWHQHNFKRLKTKLIPIVLIVIGCLMVRFVSLGTIIGGYGDNVHLNTRPLTILKAPVAYALKYFTFYRYSESIIVSILVITILLGISIPYIKNANNKKIKRNILFVSLLFIATIIPVINLEISSLFSIQSDRYGYFSTIVFSISLSYLISYWERKHALRISFLLIISFSFLTIKDTMKWRDASLICNQYLNELSGLDIDKSNVLLINTPDNYHGVYVLRNGISDFLAMKKITAHIDVLNYQNITSKNWGKEIENDTNMLNITQFENSKKYDQILLFRNGKFTKH